MQNFVLDMFFSSLLVFAAFKLLFSAYLDLIYTIFTKSSSSFAPFFAPHVPREVIYSGCQFICTENSYKYLRLCFSVRAFFFCSLPTHDMVCGLLVWRCVVNVAEARGRFFHFIRPTF